LTAQIFPTIDQIMDIIFAELPSGVYAEDRADDPNPNNRSYSSSEIRAHAQMYANLYANMEEVNADKFLTTVTHDGLSSWEKELFQTAQDSSQPDSVRLANLLAKFRASGGISTPAIAMIIHSILDPVGLTFDISTWNGCGGTKGGAWILDVSELDVETYLALEDPLLGARRDMTPLDCSLNYAAAGITAQDLIDIQDTAYTYEVRIYGNASSQVLAQLDYALTQYEPARSTHVIINNFPPDIDPNFVDMGPFTGDTLIDDIDCGRFTRPGATYDPWDFMGF
jgi:hypothetical protein